MIQKGKDLVDQKGKGRAGGGKREEQEGRSREEGVKGSEEGDCSSKRRAEGGRRGERSLSGTPWVSKTGTEHGGKTCQEAGSQEGERG